MKKHMIVMLLGIAVLFGGILMYKLIMGFMLKRYLQQNIPLVTVSASRANFSSWQPKITVSGSLRAIRGVDVTTELAGLVQTIYFTPGSYVQAGTLLVQLDVDAETAKLRSLQAKESLSKINYQRNKQLLAKQAVSQAVFDTEAANLLSLRADVAEQTAIIAKKTLRAPFTGRLGISQINPGQYINPGEKIVSLQALDPLYVDFYLPQQELARIKVGNGINVTSDTFPHKLFSGSVTTINPVVNNDNRNVAVEGIIQNPQYILTPGMYVTIEVVIGQPKSFITLPQTAISFNPYGEMVFVISDQGKDQSGKPRLIANQKFVKTGDVRGDQIAIVSGLKLGEMVVTSGQLKLTNGARVVIDNSIVPANNPAPLAAEEE